MEERERVESSGPLGECERGREGDNLQAAKLGHQRPPDQSKGIHTQTHTSAQLSYACRLPVLACVCAAACLLSNT